MKKLLFSFVMMIALVIVAGTAFGQSKYTDAYVGANHNYTVGGLNTGDEYQFIITAATIVTPPLNPVAGSVFDMSSGTGTTVGTAPISVTANIKWNTIGDYNVWLQVKNGTTGCYNYRYQTVHVTAYPVKFTAFALTAGDDLTLPGQITIAGGPNISACPGFVNENFNAAVGNTPTEGSTYIYFKITRSLTTGTTSNSNWTFTPSTTNSTATGWAYSYDANDFASTISMDTPFTVDNSSEKHDVIYIRATLANVVETTPNVTLNIGTATTSTAFEVTGNIKDTSVADDMSTLNLNLLPQAGGFTGN